MGYNPAMDLSRRLRIPIWREGRVVAERTLLMRDPVFSGQGIPRGHGTPVMLVPGFLAGDMSLALMARWLRDLGYRPTRAHFRANVDCSERALNRLEALLQTAHERHGDKVSIVGHSRGGTMARVLAVRRPDIVGSIVCLGSPMSDQFNVHPLVGLQVRAVATLGSLGVPGMFSHACSGDCCARAFADARAPFPAQVGFTSVYSRGDGVVAWPACLDPAARQVEVNSSHVGMAMNAQVYRVIAEALADDRRGDQGPALSLSGAGSR